MKDTSPEALHLKDWRPLSPDLVLGWPVMICQDKSNLSAQKEPAQAIKLQKIGGKQKALRFLKCKIKDWGAEKSSSRIQAHRQAHTLCRTCPVGIVNVQYPLRLEQRETPPIIWRNEGEFLEMTVEKGIPGRTLWIGLVSPCQKNLFRKLLSSV